mgnify:CR=1 FL=1
MIWKGSSTTPQDTDSGFYQFVEFFLNSKETGPVSLEDEICLCYTSQVSRLF